ncbi:cellulose synthase complex periplasmic endoglucanase BcsZ [Pandoraea sputorum]|uniref:Glucanase n=1 Tax=Pandoraea sputorum TaxID=93222 RepID=A0A239SJC0_9BURK|nr:cellulose synthase complex periplasmic endoglucanase BcsZ [Pandoraea sputorum]AJC16963.1 endo-1,4-D-glucanase [Pandoraea sputorum]SNU84773.1 Endoglucanase precursor [Pandoraea sputorum]VVD79690.1 endo-1,4-D-glucanase [Pandoraea sputorum]
MTRADADRRRRRAVLRALVACGAGPALAGLTPASHAAPTAPTAPAKPSGASAPGGKPVAGGKACPPVDWASWTRFKAGFLSDDGRVVDHSMADQRTVSEGQAYALTFAVIANDRATFDKVLDWTVDNLAQGDLTAHLPAWLWGKKDDGQWGVLDSNPASDADMWIAYALGEAGRLWNVRRYTALGALVARRIASEETDFIPGLGRTLLPAPVGFHPAKDLWRLNPSYVPMQVVRRLAGLFPESGWGQLITSSLKQITLTAPPLGFAPEWAMYRAGRGFDIDPETQGEGSYNAIRVYLWAGMLAPGSDDFRALMHSFPGMLKYVAAHGAPPERVNTRDGTAKQEGGSGFSAALVPLLQAVGDTALARAQAERARSLDAQSPPGYYSSVLSLFGLGWHEARFRFAADGTLQVPWEAVCATR